MEISLSLIVEDRLSDSVVRKMLQETGKNYKVTDAFSWNKHKIKKEIKNINKAARGYAYFVLTDQDTADRCPPEAIKELPEAIHPNLLYRFAVMEIESWIMADRTAFARFLSIPVRHIPTNTDTIAKPKEFVVGLARNSKSSRIRQDLAPQPNSIRKVGPDYNAELGEFVLKHWNVNIASQYSPSLKRAFAKLRSFRPTPPKP